MSVSHGLSEVIFLIQMHELDFSPHFAVSVTETWKG